MRYLATILIAASTVAAQAPDQIYVNGKIITVDDTFSIVEAVAIRGERILATGSNAEIRRLADADTEVRDLGGRTVVPGLIDNHNHIIRATEHWLSEARLDGITARSEALAAIEAKADALPPGAWIFTLGGWFEDQFTDDKTGFTLDELDAVTRDHPAFIQSKYDHAFVNTAWLEVLRFPVNASRADTENAEGLAADIARDATGRATGRLDGGFWMISRAIERFPPVTDEEQHRGIIALMEHCNRLGLTTVFDAGGMGIQETSYQRIQKLADAGEMTLRIYYTLWGGLDPSKADELITKLETIRPFQGDDMYRQIALGEIYYQPFHFDNLTRTVSPTDDEIATARRILTAAAANGWPVETHATQPSTINRLFDVIEAVDASHPVRALRWSITHADIIGAPEIERARRLGMNLQLRSQATIGGREAAYEMHGDAVYDMPPLRLVQDSGIVFGLGTDGTKAAQINPFISLWWATTGKRLDGETATRQLLTREEALIAHTRTNALMIFQEANLGAIKPGLLADLVVLDRDYMTIPLEEIRYIQPVVTMVGGKVVYTSE